MSLLNNISPKTKVSASLNRGMGATILDAHNTQQSQNKAQASLINNTGGYGGGRRRKRGGSAVPVCKSAPNVPSTAPTYLGGNSNKMYPNGNQNIFSALTTQKSQVANSALDNTGGWASVKAQSGGAPDLGNFIESLNNMSGGRRRRRRRVSRRRKTNRKRKRTIRRKLKRRRKRRRTRRRKKRRKRRTRRGGAAAGFLGEQSCGEVRTHPMFNDCCGLDKAEIEAEKNAIAEILREYHAVEQDRRQQQQQQQDNRHLFHPF